MPRPRRGFVLIIVLGLLGVLAFLALEMVEQSRQARTLSLASVLDTHTHLLARSGIERGKQEIFVPYLASTPLPLAAPHPYQNTDLVVTLPIDATGDARVRIGDSNGKICLNDGMAAGKAELGSTYNPSALDPWPAPGVQEVSAWINLRLRRILNAYGDVHKFASDIGWPSWQVSVPEPTFNRYFKHTCTAGAGGFASLPPRNFSDGLAITNPALSAGLGDRIIGARPPRGFVHMNQVKEILNRWGAEFLSTSYLQGGQGFYDKAQGDLCLQAWIDKGFWRMRREFGTNNLNFTDQANIGWYGYNVPLNDPIIDFRNLWKPHPLPPINLNTASSAVRAAVFLAHADIHMVCEGSRGAIFQSWGSAGYAHNIQNVNFEMPTLGVCRPVIRGTLQGLANGRSIGNAQSGPLSSYQQGRLLSVRDAMIVSQAYGAIGLTSGWPDSFERFAWHLRRIMVQAKPLERARSATYGGMPRVITGGSADTDISVDQWALSEFYPHILSLQRRLPGWLGAPLALVSTWRLDTENSHLSDRKVEDFVFRSHLPKVMFLPGGLFSLSSKALLSQGTLISRRSIGVQMRLFDTATYRDQASFLSLTDTVNSSPQIKFGPEPSGGSVPPSPHLGTVGLHDRGERIPVPLMMGDLGVRYDFNDSLTRFAGNISHVAPVDPPLQTELANSFLEGNQASIFPEANDEDPGDLSPFGGIYLSSFRQDFLHSTKAFQDSFYFRPETFLLPSPTEPIGFKANKGLVSCWIRVPTIQGSWGRSNVFHLTLWERLDALRTPSTLATEMGRLRPITLSLGAFKTWSQDFIVNSFEFSIGIGNDSQSGGHLADPNRGYQFEPWPQLLSVPLPVDQADYLGNALYGKMMFPWNRIYNPADYLRQFRAPNSQNYARETGITDTVSCPPSIGPSANPNFNPYVFRPGSWVRLTCIWDASQREVNLDSMFTVIPHSLQGINPRAKLGGQSPGLFHPKMMLSLGERPYQKKPTQGATGSFPSAVMGQLYPGERLNSCLDNVVLLFGALPATLHPNGAPADTTTCLDRQPFHDAIQNLPFFNSRRYNISASNEPSWVIDPKLPAGSKILQFGARIYDVPFTPEYGPDPATGNIWASWPVKAPRVDPDLLDVSLANFQNNPLAPVQRASPCHEWGITLKSRGWASYNLPAATATTRFRLRYRNQDTVINRSMLTHENDPANLDGRTLDDVLTDIPWIQEVSWRWIPAGGMKVLSWEQE